MQMGQWFTDYEELLSFARVLEECGAFVEDTKMLLTYFEKPWKWTPEHEKWIALGRPIASDIPCLEDLQT